MAGMPDPDKPVQSNEEIKMFPELKEEADLHGESVNIEIPIT